MSASNLDTAVKQVVREFGKCPVCRKPVERIDSVWMVDRDGYVLTARCHGSKESATIVVVDEFSFEPEQNVLGKVVDWLHGLFKADMQPDVLELIRYNANPWHLETLNK